VDPDIATVAGSDTCPSARNAGELLVGFVRARIDAPRRRIGVLSHAEQRESFIAEDLPICTLRDVARHVVRREQSTVGESLDAGRRRTSSGASSNLRDALVLKNKGRAGSERGPAHRSVRGRMTVGQRDELTELLRSEDLPCPRWAGRNANSQLRVRATRAAHRKSRGVDRSTVSTSAVTIRATAPQPARLSLRSNSIRAIWRASR
jgi:hypothetical protein